VGSALGDADGKKRLAPCARWLPAEVQRRTRSDQLACVRIATREVSNTRHQETPKGPRGPGWTMDGPAWRWGALSDRLVSPNKGTTEGDQGGSDAALAGMAGQAALIDIPHAADGTLTKSPPWVPAGEPHLLVRHVLQSSRNGALHLMYRQASRWCRSC